MTAARRRSLGLHALWLAGVVGAGRGGPWLRRRGARSELATVAVIVPWYALILRLERTRPFDEGWGPDRRERATDVAFFLTTTAAALGGQAVGAGLVRRLRRAWGRRPRSDGRVARLGIVGGAALSLAVADLGHYWLHRTGHEWGPAWRLHAVHHSPQRLHLLNATRFHPLEQLVEGIVEGSALEALGFTPAQHAAHAAGRATYGQLQHANVDLDSGPLDHVFSTPDLHRWHHSEVYAEGDANYGAVTSVWDRLFGSFFRPRREFDAVLGVGRMPDFPQSFTALLRVPWDWRRIKARNAATWYGEADVNPQLHERG